MVRCLLVAVLICSWIVISNHCALLALAGTSRTVESSCPFHSKPAKPVPKPASECCKILRAISSAPLKNLAPAIVDLVSNQSERSDGEFFIARICVTLEKLDTGPPGKTSFEQLIRGMRAHAPPC
jgi:hypothetical protein